ncbi:unnamed protein product [Cladocopium goreaui]|uniref:Pentatricopeptide repeat-containing protein At4g11690 n=1 Tax=Cladocopium goreaui TaxID=2562237 RepID=A0A9P1C206_9DINO|nr:unnamed protein product [Cladocopium goreaui]
MVKHGATAESNYQWWTHSVQSGTLEHSGEQLAVEKMEKDPSATSRRHYLRLMRNLGKKGRCSQAFQAAEEMKRSGLAMDVSCYAALVEACLVSGLLDRATETLRQMRRDLGAQCSLPEETHNEFISACGFADQWERAVDLLKDLTLARQVPQISAYVSVVRSCCRCKQFPTALQLLKEMEMHSQSHYQAAQELRLELVEVLPNSHWKTWETSRAHDHPLTTWSQNGPRKAD